MFVGQSLCLLAKKHINERKADGAEESKKMWTM